MSSPGPRRERKPMPPGREALPRRERKPMPPGREAMPSNVRSPAPPGGDASTARPAVALADAGAGRRIITASWWGTGLLAVTSVAGAIDPHPLDVAAVIVALALFFGGIGAFFVAYIVAVGRSRESEIGIAAVFGLAGSAPRAVQGRLYGSLVVAVVVSVSTAAARVHSSLAFGVLATMWPLGMIGLWGAKHGAFPPRKPTPQRRRGRR